MSGGIKHKRWALLMSREYRRETDRLPPKYRNQVARKTQDLMCDPTPGGSRTPLTQYDGLCRMRAGDYRIIYAYNDTVVELLSLRRRDESTYDELDQIELDLLESFRSISGAGAEKRQIADWTELAKRWAEPARTSPEPLPHRITKVMLEELHIPVVFREQLLQINTVEDLLSCDAVPVEMCERILECVSPREAAPLVGDPLPIVFRQDLVDDVAATISGPIDTSEHQPARGSTIGRHSKADSTPAPAPLLLVSTRAYSQMIPYRGNTAKATGKEAQYRVKLDGTVQLTYSVNSQERALLTTDGHDELVALVNEAKRHGGSTQGGGGFVINEYRHVLVPTHSSGVLFAGIYTRDLEFRLGGEVISPVARAGIRPGDEWPGPHVGIKYVLAAGATDIRYESEVPGQGRQRILLSDVHGVGDLHELLRMCRDVKPNGGPVYINEARELFASVDRGAGHERLYVGHLGMKAWFPEPT